MRVNVVKKARKAIRCAKCGKPIEVGTSYRWWKHRYARKTTWHFEHGYPPQSVLTTSEKLSGLYSAQEAMHDEAATLRNLVNDFNSETPLDQIKESVAESTGDVISTIEDRCAEAEDISQEYESGADNIEEHFGETGQVSEMRDKAAAIMDWTDEVRSALDGIDSGEIEALTSPEAIADWIEDTATALESAFDSLSI